jgi:hypothetical protein
MSLRTLSQLAARRNLVGRSEDAPVATHPESGATQWIDALVAQIPTELVAAYTALVAIVVGVIPSNQSYLPLRWGILVVAVALAPVFVIIGYEATGTCATEPASARVRKHKRHVPVLECSAAAIAAATWGLATPGSPLSGTVGPTLFTICSACVAIGGATSLGVFAPWLARGNGATMIIPPRTPAPQRSHAPAPISEPKPPEPKPPESKPPESVAAGDGKSTIDLTDGQATPVPHGATSTRRTTPRVGRKVP